MAVEIVMPRLSDSMEEGTILAWLVAEGDRIEEGQPLAEIETDKATVTYEAQRDGVILGLTVGAGSCVPVGSPIAVIGDVDEPLRERSGVAATVAPAARAVSAAGPPAVSAAGPPAVSAAGPSAIVTGRAHPGVADRPKASPLARRLAAELNVDLAALSGSGPQGRVIRADVDRAAATRDARRAPALAREAPAATNGKGLSERHELTRLQRTVARRMTESRATVPDIELRAEVDMGEALALRDRLREVADPCPTLGNFVIKAAGLALRAFPRVNGAYRDDATIETFSRVNVGLAVAADQALVVPTIFDADRKSLGEISLTARALAERVRDGSITPAELADGTFTVSNLGMYGIDSFSAVINPPQAAILAVGAVRRRPVVEESGELAARPTMVLTLACDHRILYGADGARFLDRVRDLLQRPHSLLL